VMIEYADYRCPFCAQFHQGSRPGLQPLVDDGTLRIEFRDLVLFEEASLLAAVAGRAAAEQDLLAPFQAEVFALSLEEAADYDRDDLVQVAEQVGVPDLDAFRADLDDEAILAAVQADTAEARAVGIGSTPTFLINTQVVQGTYPAEQFVEVIEAEAAKVERTGAG
jgi:protein-disulfide isomerase